MIKLLSLFSGIGAFETALRRGGHDYQLIGYCEIDKYAANAYSQIHGVSENYNLVDVTKVNTVLMDDVDLITYGFPCQDISAAGKQRGFEDKDGNRTRSGLFFEALRIIEETRPLYAIAENVKALTSKKFEKEFKTVLDSLDGAGYNNYWAVLNAKDYGIPQNRERVFIVSIRKDIDKGGFKFPEKMPLNIRVKDILENNVDEKYYINTEKARQLIKKLLDKNRITGVEVCDATVNAPNVRDISNAIISRYDAGISNQRSWGTAVIEPHVKRLGNLYSDTAGGARAGNTYDPEGLSPTLQTAQGGNRQPLIIEPHANKIVRAGTLGKHETDDVLSVCGISKTLKATDYKNPVKIMVSEPKIKIVGRMDGYERTGRVYSSNGIACNLLARADSMQILEEPIICRSIGRNLANPSDRSAGIPTEQRLEPNTDGVSNTLTTVQKDNYLLESAVLRQERTEYGKQIRKAYENGEINEKRSNIRELTPRDDGITNTLTTVQKDNYLLEAPKINVVGNLRGHSQMGRVFSTDGLSGCLSHADAKEPIKILQPVVIGSTQQHAAVKNDGVCPCLTACMGTGGGQIPMITDDQQIDCCGYRIRKLTPLECFRLMGFSDEEFNRIKGVSNTQLYKMAGNSIVVNVLEGIFNNLLRG